VFTHGGFVQSIILVGTGHVGRSKRVSKVSSVVLVTEAPDTDLTTRSDPLATNAVSLALMLTLLSVLPPSINVDDQPSWPSTVGV
jgi:hypothetical protein